MIGLAKLALGPGNVGLADRPERGPGAGEALLEVRGAGVCGTDLHIEADEYASVPPVTMGHEVSAVVREVGADVDPGWIGARVVSETYFSTCGTCEWCRDGRPNLCPERRSIGSFVDGAFAPRLVVSAGNLHRIPDWLDEHAAALTEPLACVCHCLLDPAAVTAGEPLEGFDVVVECSGAAGGAATCLEAAGRRARYVQVGVFGKPVTVPLDRLFQKELVLTSGFASTPRSWRRALALLEARQVALEPLVSEVAPLAAWERVFADLRAGRGVKVVFDPRLDG